MTIKKVVGKIHLWLGFTSGLLVFVIAITGCIYAFQKEIQELTQPYRFVAVQSGNILPPSVLNSAAKKHLPDKHIHAVQYLNRGRAAQVIYYSYEPDYYYIAYINPYTAEVLHVTDMSRDFFHLVLDGHFYLWLPPEIGQPIVATATIVFLLMLISGIFLWWPRKKQDMKQRFKVKWTARWRRVNYDLHNVLGFYAWAIAFVFAVTGLVWGFQWWANGMYAAVGGEKSLTYIEPASDTSAMMNGSAPAIDQVFYKMTKEYPNARAIEVHVPDNTTTSIAANANSEDDTYWKLEYRYFDQYTLNEIPVDHIYGRLEHANGADKLLRMNYDIHTGAIFGLPGKMLAFFASFIIASLPVTGTYIWWGRRNKEKKEQRSTKHADTPLKPRIRMLAEN